MNWFQPASGAAAPFIDFLFSNGQWLRKTDEWFLVASARHQSIAAR
jgi:hypothetical protein